MAVPLETALREPSAASRFWSHPQGRPRWSGRAFLQKHQLGRGKRAGRGAERTRGSQANWRKAGMSDSLLARLCVQMRTNTHERARSLWGAQQNSEESKSLHTSASC